MPLYLAEVEASSPQIAFSSLSTLKNKISPSHASSIAKAEVPQSSHDVSTGYMLPHTFKLLIGLIDFIVPERCAIPLNASEIWQAEIFSSKDWRLIYSL